MLEGKFDLFKSRSESTLCVAAVGDEELTNMD